MRILSSATWAGGRSPLRRVRFVALAVVLIGAFHAAVAAAPERVRLAGHVLPALAEAVPAAARAGAADGNLVLTVVLARSDPAAFEQYLRDLYDPASPRFRQFGNPRELSDRFGPRADDYAAVRGWFAQNGYTVTADSANRMTLTLSAPRAVVERTLDTTIGDYAIGAATFHANDRDPALPADVARRVQAITGLANLAVPAAPAPLNTGIDGLRDCYQKAGSIQGSGNAIACGVGYFLLAVVYDLFCLDPITYFQGCRMIPPIPGRTGTGAGNGQTIGIVAFDSFHASDVADFLAYTGAPPERIARLSRVDVGGGAAPGANQSEVLLDVDTVMTIAPNASWVVYSAPFSGNTSFQALFNRMIDDGVTVISNSWAYCEDQTTLADVESIDAILATAAAAGISVFNASGDTGSTCLDGSAGVAAVPASSPHATAVGGTSIAAGDGFVYAGETWWNGSATVPVTGQGGYGVSRFFARPAWQDGFTASPMRSVPDLAVNADPVANGVPICQAAAGGCPSGLLYGGTSIAAPTMAALVAELNAARGSNLGLLNPQIYPLAASGAFHTPAAMGTDFAHVGLGSPNVSVLDLALDGVAPGPADAALSIVSAVEPVAVADSAVPTSVLVQLRDGGGHAVSGRTVRLSASVGSAAAITPATAVSDANGVAAFAVTDATLEEVTFGARAVGDNVDLASTATVRFVAPPAASGGITAFPTTAAANGSDGTSITITLRDALNRPTPGKTVALAQNGRSIAVGPTPSVTDANGQIVFTATDTFEETVTYTATDVTDGNLPVPGTAVVTFSGAAAGSCVLQPSAGDGYTLEPFANGFAPYPFFYGNVNFGCRGATDAAFDADGNAYVSHFQTGSLYKFGPGGGTATAPLATGLGPSLGSPVFGRDGKLYSSHAATTGDFFTGDIVEIDPATGAVVRQVATNLTCPGGLAFDPLGGDLFFTDTCFGAGSDNPSLFRLTDPGDADPDRPTQVTVYATLPRTPNGAVAFSPDGTIYVQTGYLDAAPAIVTVSGTDGPQPPVVATLEGISAFYWINVGAANPDGSARSLILLQHNDTTGTNDLNLVDITTTPPRATTLAHDIGSGTIGPDGCLYTALPDVVYKLVPDSGVCDFATTNPSPALALAPRVVTPDPQQGSMQALTVAFRNLDVPAGAPVFLEVRGANGQTRLARSDANGVATVEYEGRFAGDDVVSARATVGATVLVSNEVRIHWNAGPHASFVSILGPAAATAGVPASVRVALADVAVEPQAAIAGATVHIAAGAAGCDATTNAGGVAACTLTFAHPGVYTLVASYAGSAQHRAATATSLVVVPTDGIDLIFADGFDSGD